MEVITVPATIVPDVVTVFLRVGLYAGETFETATNQVGILEIEVPRFMFNGTQTLSMTAAGVASNDFSGSALVSNSKGCVGGGEYARIKTELFAAQKSLDWWAVQHSDHEIKTKPKHKPASS